MKKSTTKKRVPPIAVTIEQRDRIISDAAYFRALKHQQEDGKAKDVVESWYEVEAEVDAVLKHRHAK